MAGIYKKIPINDCIVTFPSTEMFLGSTIKRLRGLGTRHASVSIDSAVYSLHMRFTHLRQLQNPRARVSLTNSPAI